MQARHVMVGFLRKVLVNNVDNKICRVSPSKNCGEGLTTVASRIIKGSYVVAS